MVWVPGFPLAVVLVAVFVAAAMDLWKFTIPNLLTIPLFLSGLLYGCSGGWSCLAWSAMGALVSVGLLIVVYLQGGMGAGDIKLLAGVGAWLGPTAACYVVMVGGLATGFYAAGLALRRGRGLKTPVSQSVVPCSTPSAGIHVDLAALMGRPDTRRRLIPFGAMLALGVVATAVWMRWNGNP